MPPVVSARDGIDLEVYFIERSAQDPLIGESLWRGIDQINGTDALDRVRLNLEGIRFGIAGSNPPDAIRALTAEDANRSARNPTRVQSLTLISGQETELEAGAHDGPLTLRINGTQGGIIREYGAVRCILRLKAESLDEGWVRLSVEPEIHHGAMQIRTVATDHDWKYQESQQIDPLYEQRFSTELNVGELLVIGSLGDAPESVGQRFFRSGGEMPTERVIVIRVAGMQRVEPVRSNDW